MRGKQDWGESPRLSTDLTIGPTRREPWSRDWLGGSSPGRGAGLPPAPLQCCPCVGGEAEPEPSSWRLCRWMLGFLGGASEGHTSSCRSKNGMEP